MKKKLSVLLLIFCSFLFVKADEGMWILKELNRQNIQRMKELGFQFPLDKLYSETNPSLKDAVVIFGRGCSGVTASKDGLVFTNHHCGYGDIQKLSSVEHDYLKNGYMAKDRSNELYSKGLTVKFFRSINDVTDKVLQGISSVLNEEEYQKKVRENVQKETEKFPKKEFEYTVILPFFGGNKYYAVTYDVFKDVRLVATPPSSLGKFGGDLDNWMWPRHTCDFSLFRVYADKNNKPAKYSKDNVPYHPKYVVPVSLKGVLEKDYSMVIGYPGRTNRYLTSWGVISRMNTSNKPRIEVRGVKQDIWKTAMDMNDTIRIKYATKYAHSANYWKNSIGMNEALKQLNVVATKRELEKKMSKWIASNPSANNSFSSLFSSLKDAYAKNADIDTYETYFHEIFSSGIEIFNFGILAYKYQKSQKKEALKNYLKDLYSDYDAKLDKKVAVALIKLYKKSVPEQYLPSFYKEVIAKKFNGDIARYVDDLFNRSACVSWNKLEKALAKKGNIENDPAVIASLSANKVSVEMNKKSFSGYENILKGNRLFISALMQMEPNKSFYPDANFTQRMTYGSVKGYNPFDGAIYKYYTTSEGLIQKNRTGKPEYYLQPNIIKALEKRNFGQFADKNGNLRTCFLSDNDITGGNSGSPVFNKNAELIGLAFDGNWEALSGDIVFNEKMQRTISVDIRYVLYVIQDIMGGKNIIKELDLKK